MNAKDIPEASEDRMPWWERMLSKQEVAAVIGLSGKTVDRGVDADFPKPVYLKGRSPRWAGWKIQTWLNNKLEMA